MWNGLQTLAAVSILKSFNRATGIVGLCIAATAANAQTVINNGSNNRTTVNVQRAPGVIVIVRGQPVRSDLQTTRSAPASFPYQQRDLLPYMSPRCSQLYEVQLTSRARRTSYTTGSEVQEEFRLNCQDALSEAQKALYRDRLKSYNAKEESAKEATLAVDQSKASREQCNELLRILAAKRKRLTTMTDGERADHERSESNYRARCASA
jgi:hypothetical protein